MEFTNGVSVTTAFTICTNRDTFLYKSYLFSAH